MIDKRVVHPPSFHIGNRFVNRNVSGLDIPLWLMGQYIAAVIFLISVGWSTVTMTKTTCPKRPYRLYVREWITHKELDQADVAEMMECEPGTLSKLISGKMNWTAEWLARAAHALNIEVVDLFRHPNDTPQEDLLKNLPNGKRQEVVRVIKALTGQDT